MRIALIDKNPPNAIGGSERTNYFLGRILEEAGHKVTFIHAGTVGLTFSGGVELFYIRRLCTLIGAEIERRKDEFDLVVTSGITGWRMHFSPAIQIYNATHYGMRFHKGIWPPRAHAAWKICCGMEKVGGRGKTIVGVSEPTKREAEEQYGLHDVRVIQNGIDTDHFCPRPDKAALRGKFDLPQDKFLAVFVGRLSPQKGLDILTKTADSLPGNMAIVAGIPEAVGLHKNIIERLAVPIEDMPELYSACDCFILPSRNEGCSLSLIEAMSCGLPSVVSKVGHAVDIAEEDPILGRLIVDGLNPADYLDRLTMLSKDADLCADTSRRGREYALRHNSLAAFSKAYLDLIAEIMSKQ